VHEARKDLKKLRAALRLVRDDIGRKAYRRENHRFRDAGRRLSAARDAEVKLDTLKALAERFDGELPVEAASRLEDALGNERAEATAQVEREGDGSPRAAAVSEIEAGRAAIDDWPLGDGGWELFAPGVKRSYRRGRRRLAEVHANPSAETVHEWRKRVKDLWYHLRLLRDAWPPVLGEIADEAHRLADALGDHHDLAVLAEDAGGRAELISGEDLEQLRELVARRQDELLGEALSLGGRIYAESPKRFEARLHKYWAEWQAPG
jgi:CHAD domain-containing protein